VDGLEARGIGLRSLHENIDTTTATGRLVLHIFAALGQFEVELLKERTRSALAASRARGRVGGRPPALDAIKVMAAKAMLASGNLTAAEVARQLGCAPSTLYRHLPGGRSAIAEMASSSAAWLSPEPASGRATKNHDRNDSSETGTVLWSFHGLWAGVRRFPRD
jgi:DNA invertase Pin-like site-specific DNA recombinase